MGSSNRIRALGEWQSKRSFEFQGRLSKERPEGLPGEIHDPTDRRPDFLEPGRETLPLRRSANSDEVC